MGGSQSNLKLSSYGTTIHPIEGQVQAFSIKGEAGKFVMKTNIQTTKEHLQLIQKIGKQKKDHLLTYYGSAGQQSSIFNNGNSEKIETEMYWQLLNHDLSKQIERVKSSEKYIEQSVLWEIIDCTLSACLFLRKFNLYPELSPKKIQFMASMQPKLYWTDILPNNMHRAYNRYIHYEEFRHTIYAPEELLQITRTQRRAVDPEKSVLFNLGMIILQTVAKKQLKYMYDYQHKTFSEVKKREELSKMSNIYSKQLCELLTGILQFFPKDRSSYSKLEQQVNLYYKREPLTICLDAQSQIQQKTENLSNGQTEGKDENEIKINE